MDFKDNVKQLTERIKTLKENLQTEEATKNALIMPFITALGYDVFNPLEVVPEMVCDIGSKKGEKIDYAILKDGQPVILIECKHWQQDLDNHNNQLLRYFGVSKAKFGILTNGIQYRFYTDLAEKNVMDEKPFLEVDLSDPKEAQIEELKKFHKSYFDVDSILSTASELKYANDLRNILQNEFQNPSDEFVKFLGKQVYDGAFTAKACEQFRPIVKRSIATYINDIISDRLKAAMKESDTKAAPEEIQAEPAPEQPEIVTTEEELQAFYIIRSILGQVCPVDDIIYIDNKTTFTVYHTSNKAKAICRFESSKNKINRFVVCYPEIVKYNLESVNDLYKHAEAIKTSLLCIIGNKHQEANQTNE